ncbi:hypothetical protein K440DRAFT_313621 [Wilcoxina mikolae CBS 423.85]|nr:hypothetical protein K440DRAFT_313621 [Wilcoxina mikolae CBS 423.85]
MSRYGWPRTDDEYAEDEEEIESIHSVSDGRNSHCPLSTGTRPSPYQQYQRYSPPEDRFDAPRPLDSPVRCYFWFTGCCESFAHIESNTWLRHVIEHLTQRERVCPPEALICGICGSVSEHDSWDSVFLHAFEHIWNGMVKPDMNLLEYLERWDIITREELLVAMRSPRSKGRDGGTLGTYGEHYNRYNSDMAYTVRAIHGIHMGSSSSRHEPRIPHGTSPPSANIVRALTRTPVLAAAWERPALQTSENTDLSNTPDPSLESITTNKCLADPQTEPATEILPSPPSDLSSPPESIEPPLRQEAGPDRTTGDQTADSQQISTENASILEGMENVGNNPSLSSLGSTKMTTGQALSPEHESPPQSSPAGSCLEGKPTIETRFYNMSQSAPDLETQSSPPRNISFGRRTWTQFQFSLERNLPIPIA